MNRRHIECTVRRLESGLWVPEDTGAPLVIVSAGTLFLPSQRVDRRALLRNAALLLGAGATSPMLSACTLTEEEQDAFIRSLTMAKQFFTVVEALAGEMVVHNRTDSPLTFEALIDVINKTVGGKYTDKTTSTPTVPPGNSAVGFNDLKSDGAGQYQTDAAALGERRTTGFSVKPV